MPGPIKRLIPSMFARRLILLAGAVVLSFVVLACKLAWITTAEAAARKQAAESVLTSTHFVPTVRGRILDCKDRVLATEKASYDVAVHYNIITGDWAYQRARREAYAANRYRWKEMGVLEKERVIHVYEGRYDQELTAFWAELAKLGNVSESELAERKAVVVQKVQQVASHLWVKWQQREEKRLEGNVPLYRVAKPIGEENALHAMIDDVSAQARVRIAQMIAEAPRGSIWHNNGPALRDNVAIIDARRRVYPHEVMEVSVDRATFPLRLKNEEPLNVRLEGVAMHALGNLRSVWAEDYEREGFRRFVNQTGGRTEIDLGGYRPGDFVGNFGIESSQEDTLRGARGKRTIDRVTGETIEAIEPQRGHDVALSLDIHLQARVEAVMSQDESLGLMRRQPWHESQVAPETIGKPLNGAAVVMDISRGQVRAAVSVPGISRTALAERRNDLASDHVNLPMWYRPVAMAYYPGSTVKPLVLAAGVTDRQVGYDEQVDCLGYFDPAHRNVKRCWIYNYFGGHHGPLDGSHAIMHSCNIYFYTLGKRFGSRRLVGWYERFGLGQLVNCGIAGEARGDLPDLTQSASPNTPGFALNDAIYMAIGQGPIKWTPLQAARAYATLARNGAAVHPTFLAQPEPREEPDQDWNLDPKGVQMALEGLRLATTDEGSVHHITWESEPGVRQREPIFNVKGIAEGDLIVMAKSGTADTGVTTIDGVTAKRGDHAWTICLVQRATSARPDFVIVVVTEYAGSGARVSGPIANQILHAMRAEGYL